MNAQLDIFHRLDHPVGLRQRIDKITAGLPERVDLPALRGENHVRGRQPFRCGRRKTPEFRLRQTPRVFLGDGNANHVSGRYSAHLGASLHAAVASNRHETSVRPANVSLRKLKIHDGADIVAAVAMLRDPHAPNNDGVPRIAERFGKAQHVAASKAGAALEIFPGKFSHLFFGFREARGALVDEFAVEPVVFDEIVSKRR